MDKIKKFCILRVGMQGFKRFKDAYVADLDRVAYISGGNGQGKTTIADAIAFAFCGTPFWGEKSCDRLQNNESPEMMVQVDFVDENGEIHNLIRRKSGNNTVITLDKNQLRQVDLTNRFADKDIFLSIFNPLYFIEKIAEDGRELLQRLLPVIEDETVLEKLSESTRTLLENESLLEPEFYIKKKREELKEIDKNIDYFEGQIDLLQTQQKEAGEKIDSVVAKGEQIYKRKSELEEKQFEGIDIDILKAKLAEATVLLSDQKREKLIASQVELQNKKYESKFAAQLAEIKAQLEALSKRCSNLLAQAKSIKVGDKCPTCHTVVTEANYATIIAGIQAKYNETYKKGQELTATQKELQELDEKSRAKFEEFRTEDLKRIENELAVFGNHSVSEITMIENKIRLGNLTEEEFAELTELTKQADAYTVEVNALCETDKAPEKIAEIQKKIAYNENKRKELNSLIHAAGEFAAKKAELTLAHLKMNHASIKLFEVAKTTGEVRNIFRFTYDGKDYRWLSTSEKVKAGLEVAKLLARLTGLAYPTYIDNAECITTGIEPMHGQLIAAFAKKTELTITLPLKKSEQQVKEAA